MNDLSVNSYGARGFFEWMKKAQPGLYSQFKRKFQPAGLGDIWDEVARTSTSSLDPATTASNAPMQSGVASSIKDIVLGIGQAYLTKNQVDAQNKILNIQLDRAQRNLPPLNIDPSTYGLQPTIRAGLAPDTQKLFIYGGAALLGVMLFGSYFKHRR